MKILLIGGTGNISREVTALAASMGWDVTLLNRGRTKNLPIDTAAMQTWQADIHDEAQVAALLRGQTFDVVANFIAFRPEDAARDIRLFAGKTRQYVFVSSASVYRKPLSHYVITEGTPLANPYWEYARNKIACEALYMEAYRGEGFPVTIVRPSHTYGETKVPVGLHGANGEWAVIKRLREGKPILVPGDGSSLWTMTHSRDFARAFIGLLGNIHAVGEAVHITSDESLTWNQIYAAIGNALGVAPKLTHVSTDFIAACEPGFAGTLLGDKSETVVFDNRKLKRLVPGFYAEIRFDQGVRESLQYLLSRPALQKEDPTFERFTDAVVQARQDAAAAVRKKMGLS